MPLLKNRTEYSILDFLFIKIRVAQLLDYPLGEKYSTNISNTRHINTIHK